MPSISLALADVIFFLAAPEFLCHGITAFVYLDERAVVLSPALKEATNEKAEQP